MLRLNNKWLNDNYQYGEHMLPLTSCFVFLIGERMHVSACLRYASLYLMRALCDRKYAVTGLCVGVYNAIYFPEPLATTAA
jgi:hypothetical protein